MTTATTEFEQQWHGWHAGREAWAREPLGRPSPIAPPENRLCVAVEAGERDPRREVRS